jgi:hypothetical protein
MKVLTVIKQSLQASGGMSLAHLALRLRCDDERLVLHWLSPWLHKAWVKQSLRAPQACPVSAASGCACAASSKEALWFQWVGPNK